MRDTTQPKFLSLHDLGLLLVDSGRKVPSRQTLQRRGREFAAAAGLRTYRVRGKEYVSQVDVDRLHSGVTQ